MTKLKKSIKHLVSIPEGMVDVIVSRSACSFMDLESTMLNLI